MRINILCTVDILLLYFLFENASSESPRCERRLVCGSDGQVYESSCYFERALRRDQGLGARPLHECLGMMYVLMPAEYSRAHKNFTKPKFPRFVGTKMAKEIIMSGKSKVVKDIISLLGRDKSANLRTLFSRGRGFPRMVYLFTEERFLPQKNLKALVLFRARRFSMIDWIPKSMYPTIIQGVIKQGADWVAEKGQSGIEYIVGKVQDIIFDTITSFPSATPNENNQHNPNNNINNNDNINYDNNHKNNDDNNNNYNYDSHNNNYDNHNHHNNINNQLSELSILFIRIYALKSGSF